MPKVFIPSSLRKFTGGEAELEVEGTTVRQLIANLEIQYPGIEHMLLDQGRLRPNLAIAIDESISALGLLEPVRSTSEVHFIPAIRGG